MSILAAAASVGISGSTRGGTLRNAKLLVLILALASCSEDQPVARGDGDFGHGQQDLAPLADQAIGPIDQSPIVDAATSDMAAVDDLATDCMTPGAMANPAMLNFGVVLLGQLNPPRTVTLTATGGSVTVRSISLTGPNPTQFQVSDPGRFTLQCRISRGIPVAFQPFSAGEKSATMSIFLEGLPPVIVGLTGTAM